MDLETDARFLCPQCGKEVATNVLLPDPHWHEDNAPFSDFEVVTITCPSCRGEFKARANISPSRCSLVFVDHDKILISASPPTVRESDEDDWYYDVPPDPHAIFNTTLAEARLLLDHHGGDGSSLVNRMVFVHYIGAFEAFLADSLINEVLPDNQALKGLIERDERLSSKRFSLSQIAASPDLIKDTVRERLRSEVWHRIKNASALYRISFEIDIRAVLADDNPTIDQAVHFRHDCVHRNGRDKDGNLLTELTKEYITTIGSILSRVAHDLNEALLSRRAAKFFG